MPPASPILLAGWLRRQRRRRRRPKRVVRLDRGPSVRQQTLRVRLVRQRQVHLARSLSLCVRSRLRGTVQRCRPIVAADALQDILIGADACQGTIDGRPRRRVADR